MTRADNEAAYGYEDVADNAAGDDDDNDDDDDEDDDDEAYFARVCLDSEQAAAACA